MARTEGNIFVDRFRGKVGGTMVFRKRKSGKVIVAKNRKKGTTPDDSGRQGHAQKRADHQKFFPTRLRFTMIQVAKGAHYDPGVLPKNPAVIDSSQLCLLGDTSVHL